MVDSESRKTLENTERAVRMVAATVVSRKGVTGRSLHSRGLKVLE